MPWQALLLCFVLPFLVRNLLLPMVADDYSYAFIWDGDHMGNLMDDIGPRERVDSFTDILVSQWSHYFTWGGRTPSMLCIQFFAWVGKIWFDIANTLVFTLLMLVLYWLAVGEVVSPARHKSVFLWVMIGMLFGVIDFLSTMLWMTGACVYLWTGLWECIFLLYIIRGKGSCAVAAALALLAGWSEEAGSLVTVILTAWLLLIYRRQKRLERWMMVGFVFLLVGCGILMLCPGSIHREELLLEYDAEYVLPVEKLFSAEMFWDNFTGGFLPILIWESFLFIPIVLWLRLRRKARHSGQGQAASPSDSLLTSTPVIFTAGGLLVLCAMMFAPEFELRTGFHSTLFLTVGSAAALKEMAPWLKESLAATPLRRTLTLTAGCVAVAYALFTMVGCFVVETSFRQQFDERLTYVEQHQLDDSIVVKSFYIPYNLDRWLGPRSLTDFHLIYGADLEPKPTYNRSLMYALYYNLPPIRIDRETDWKKRGED